MSPEDHREAGIHYGYPYCCIEAFVADRAFDAANGSLTRSGEIRGVIVIELGQIQYVPCVKCMGAPNWVSHEDYGKRLNHPDYLNAWRPEREDD